MPVIGLNAQLNAFSNKASFLPHARYTFSMPQISFKNRPPLQVAPGTNLMKALLDADLPVASSCDGDGVCAKCRIQILAGAENLSAPNDTEEFLKESKNVEKGVRISCQVQVLGDITVHASYW
jgi:2Fe-2S ferredoxin